MNQIYFPAWASALTNIFPSDPSFERNIGTFVDNPFTASAAESAFDGFLWKYTCKSLGVAGATNKWNEIKGHFEADQEAFNFALTRESKARLNIWELTVKEMNLLH